MGLVSPFRSSSKDGYRAPGSQSEFGRGCTGLADWILCWDDERTPE